MRPTGMLRAGAALAVVLGVAACGPDTQNGIPAPASTSTAPATGSAAAPTTASPSPSPTPAAAPSAGTTLLTTTSGDTVVANAAGAGFTVLENSSSSGVDTSTLTTYDVAGNRLAGIAAASGFDARCGAADVRSGKDRLVLGETVTVQPAQGITPASYSEHLSAFDAATGRQVWTVQVADPQTDQLSCGSSGSSDLDGFTATTDGSWGVVVPAGSSSSATPVAVDLGTGQLYPRGDLQGVLGASLVTGKADDYGKGLYVLSRPPAWQGLGSFSTGNDPGLISTRDPAAIPRFDFEANGSSPGAGLSSDGTLLFSAQRTSDSAGHDATQLTAYALPGMLVAWRQDTAGQGVTYQLVGSGGNVLVVTRTAVSGTTTDGLDARTGATLWTLPQVDDTCGLTTTQLLVRANGQLAVVDLASGKQVSYTASSSAGSSTSCPDLLPGGIAVSGGTVTQVLTP